MKANLTNIKKLFEIDKYITWLMIISFFLIMFGVYFNTEARISNGGRMPVKYECNEIISTNRHFSYCNNTQVNNWLFTDIISGASIGDYLIMIGGLGIFTLYLLKMTIQHFYIEKEKKK